MTLIRLALNHLTTHQIKFDIDRRLTSVLDIIPQLLRQLSSLADADDISPYMKSQMLRFRHPPQLGSCFWRGRYPNTLNRRKRKYLPSRSKAKSISFEIRKWHILCNKKKMSKNTTKLQYQTNDWIYSVNRKSYKQILLNSSVYCSCYCFTTIITECSYLLFYIIDTGTIRISINEVR